MALYNIADRRSLAYHRAVMEKLQSAPEQIDYVILQAEKWIADGNAAAIYLHSWLKYLRGPRDALWAFMVSEDEHAVAHRSASPFVGIISPQERWKIWKNTVTS